MYQEYQEQLKSPYPYMGGKSRVAAAVWERFGDVPNYCEPFAGSLAVLLARPHAPRVETVNDLDCYISNFWRALSADPAAVAHYADHPVNEADLHARHLWLVTRSEFRQRMKIDPDYCDPKIAGWWVWGISQWIGSGWCDSKKYGEQGDYEALLQNGGDFNLPRQKIPHLGDAGNGVHALGIPRQGRPHLGDAGRGVHAARANDLHEYMHALSARLRRARVCCGDWSRILGPLPTTKLGLTAVFLDPPYSRAERDAELYANEDDCAPAVRAWAIENGNNPLLRIALCGYSGEHEMPDDWECYAWKAPGGYGSRGNGRARDNAERERIWFSPHCIKPRAEHEQLSIFELEVA